MARNGKSSHLTHESPSVEPAAASGFHLLDGGLGAARELLNGSLAAAQNVASWIEQSQRLHAQAVTTWHENLDAAMRDAEQADDLQKLMRVTTQLVNRQMGTAIQQFGASVKQAVETEAQWVERMRNTTLGLSQRMLQTGILPRLGEAADHSPLAQLSQAQAEWLAMTQRWMDSIPSAQKPQHH